MRRRSKIITVVVSAIITYAAGVFVAGNVYGYRNCGYHHHRYPGHHWHNQSSGENEKSGEKIFSADTLQQNQY